MLTSGRSPPRRLLGRSAVAASGHGWMPMPGRTIKVSMPGRTIDVSMPGRTIEKGARKDQTQSIITAAKTAATLTVSDTVDPLHAAFVSQRWRQGPRA
jgi:hypothetical protein